jgi:homogentisate 1,2-dioxygenase
MDGQRNYLSGFGNYFASEAIPNTLPQDQNSPQRVTHDLYAEQLSGSAFTMPRHQNLHSWLYRILPSVKQKDFTRRSFPELEQPLIDDDHFSPEPLRWSAFPYPDNQKDWLEGLTHFASNSGINEGGASIYLYAANKSMQDRYFGNNDGELLIVLQEGGLVIHTEFGIIDAQPAEIVVIPRGIKFSVSLVDEKARGYVLENYGAPFRLPELGVIGANGLAYPRHFLVPTAAFEEKPGEMQLFIKFSGKIWRTILDHSPLNVVAWYGNYVPYKYDLKKFNTINTVSFDHIDPSIFTVLTSPSLVPGTANVDFAIFPERWMVAEHTFRPPYYHRNVMNEYMGLIIGIYDAKQEGFVPGGGSLHNCMVAHGPDAQAFEQNSTQKLMPQKLENTLAFMFESNRPWRPTSFALDTPIRQKDYAQCWQELRKGIMFR